MPQVGGCSELLLASGTTCAKLIVPTPSLRVLHQPRGVGFLLAWHCV